MFLRKLLTIKLFPNPIPRAAGMILAASTLAACSSIPDEWQIWRQVPIQMSRVPQTDSYKQTYVIDVDQVKSNEELTKTEKQDKRMDQIFNTLIGEKNWQNLKNLYGVNDIRDEVVSGDVSMEGTINFTAYLDPVDQNYIVLEGSGRFFAIRNRIKSSQEQLKTILLSGDYHIVPQRYPISSLKSTCIPMDIKIYTTRIPGKITYYHDATIRYDLRIKSYKKNVYSLNYQSEHKGYLDMDNDGEYKSNEYMASLKMNSEYYHVKLIDLSGLEFIKNYTDETKKKANLDLKIAELQMASRKTAQKDRQCVAPDETQS